jgi:hypothetical protein
MMSIIYCKNNNMCEAKASNVMSRGNWRVITMRGRKLRPTTDVTSTARGAEEIMVRFKKGAMCLRVTVINYGVLD